MKANIDLLPKKKKPNVPTPKRKLVFESNDNIVEQYLQVDAMKSTTQYIKLKINLENYRRCN